MSEETDVAAVSEKLPPKVARIAVARRNLADPQIRQAWERYCVIAERHSEVDIELQAFEKTERSGGVVDRDRRDLLEETGALLSRELGESGAALRMVSGAEGLARFLRITTPEELDLDVKKFPGYEPAASSATTGIPPKPALPPPPGTPGRNPRMGVCGDCKKDKHLLTLSPPRCGKCHDVALERVYARATNVPEKGGAPPVVVRPPRETERLAISQVKEPTLVTMTTGTRTSKFAPEFRARVVELAKANPEKSQAEIGQMVEPKIGQSQVSEICRLAGIRRKTLSRRKSKDPEPVAKLRPEDLDPPKNEVLDPPKKDSSTARAPGKGKSYRNGVCSDCKKRRWLQARGRCGTCDKKQKQLAGTRVPKQHDERLRVDGKLDPKAKRVPLDVLSESVLADRLKRELAAIETIAGAVRGMAKEQLMRVLGYALEHSGANLRLELSARPG